MQAIDVAQRYFDAWQRHDGAAIVATFAEGGTYNDPATGQPLSGPAIAGYAGGLWAAFPDLSFDIISVAPAGDGMVAAQWLMRGTNSGSMRGLPPTGRSVALPGADFIRVEGGKIRSVQGYFDMKTFSEQLGLQIVVQPYTAGPFCFGTSTSVQSGKRTRPGAFSITALQVRSDEEVEHIRAYSRSIAGDMLKMSGFIGWVGVLLGQRMITLTAWENLDDIRQLHANGPHQKAMQEFFGPNHYVGGMTSVWIPERINAMWMRCPHCDRMVNHERQQGRCECGELLPEPLPYW
ncbi:MAG: ester cyclase [Anaerolineales bacterium]|nr:ester cyclase [Anaerolineales bacterium]